MDLKWHLGVKVNDSQHISLQLCSRVSLGILRSKALKPIGLLVGRLRDRGDVHQSRLIPRPGTGPAHKLRFFRGRWGAGLGADIKRPQLRQMQMYVIREVQSF